MKQQTLRSRIAAAGACGLAIAGLWLTGSAQGAGLLIAEGGFGGVLEMEDHKVNVTVDQGVAVTRVEQTFRNTENRQVEALYTFPVPHGASVANFSMWINGKEMVGEVLEKERAREIYNSYKRVRKDPGLLEQNDYKSFEMRIFPIAPNATQRVEVVYYQELNVDHDWATYVYPLATTTEKAMDTRVHGTFSMNLEVRSTIPIAEVESPSHGAEFVIANHSESVVQASLEANQGSLARDVVLAYHLARPKTGVDVITSSEPGEDGFFKLTLTAGEDLAKLDEGMDYLFLLDVSGSMGEDRKLQLSRSSISAFLESLGAEDRFDLMAFNVQPNTLNGALTAVNEATLEAAGDFLDDQRSRGGTVLNNALEAAYGYKDPDRVLNVVVLSDGLTEQRERRQLASLISGRPSGVRVFCIGVGNDVNRPLLEQLAQRSGGLAAFISRGDNFERQAQAFRRKLMHPVATDLELTCEGVRLYDLVPSKLPNLYYGSPVTVYGRYRRGGEAKIALNGNIRGREVNQKVELTFPNRDPDHPEIERMWAWRQMDQLLKEADASGSRDSVVDEVVRLGETYSIVSEYTSFLVLENDAEYRRWKIDRKNLSRIARDRGAQERRQEDLAVIRSKAAREIGPMARQKQVKEAANPAVRRNVSTPTTSSRTPGPTSQSRDFDLGLGGGSGPIGTLFLGLMALLGRRRKQG